jgi:hypothetical protein
MSRRRIALTTSVAALAIASIFIALPGAAQAENTVTATATKSGSTATVTGTATFGAITAPESVVGTASDTDFQQADVAKAAGIDLVDAQIAPLADGSGLRFIWKVSSLPDQVPPEAVRYTWSFKIGDTQYQLQAKRTNIASITTAENPVGHVKQLASQQPFFQLRGACVASYEGTPTAGCYHLAFLKGSFDVANKAITIDLPFNTRDDIGRLVAPDFKPGVKLVENLTAGMSIVGAFQAVIGNTSTSDYINGWSPFFIGPQVALAVGPADADTSDPEALAFGPNLTLNANGSFSGTISGLTATNNTVYVRACNGESCAFTSVTP